MRLSKNIPSPLPKHAFDGPSSVHDDDDDDDDDDDAVEAKYSNNTVRTRSLSHNNKPFGMNESFRKGESLFHKRDLLQTVDAATLRVGDVSNGTNASGRLVHIRTDVNGTTSIV